jgi:BolA protein
LTDRILALTGARTYRYAGFMRTQDVITRRLTEAFSPESLSVVDESHMHEGHAGHRPGGETHFRVYIVSDAFKGKTRLERHRMINAVLAAELADRVHALALHPAAPGEAARSA